MPEGYSKEQESIHLRISPAPVSASEQTPLHTSAPPSSVDGLDSATSAARHATCTPASESTSKLLSIDTQEASSLRSSTTSSCLSLVNSLPLHEVSMEPIPDRPALASNVAIQAEVKLINRNSIGMNQLDTLSMLAKQYDAPSVALAPNSSAATQTTHVLAANSASRQLNDEFEKLVNLQASTASSHSLFTDSPQTREATAELTIDLLARSDAVQTLLSGVDVQALGRQIEGDNYSIIDRLSTSSTMLAEESDILHSPRDELPSATSAATRTTHALIAESALKTLRTDNQRLANLQTSTVSSHMRLADFSLQSKMPVEPMLDQLAQSDNIPTVVPSTDIQALDRLTKHDNNAIIDRLGTPSTVTAEIPQSPHIVAPPGLADLPITVASAATRVIPVPTAESTPGRPTEGQTTFRRELHRSRRGAAMPADHSVRLDLAGSEQEPNRHLTPLVESNRSPPSEHGRHRSEALLQEEPNTSRRTTATAPLRPHTAPRPVATTLLMNGDNLPAHIRSRLVNSRRFNELFQDDTPRKRLRDRLVPIQGGGGGDDPPDNGDSYDHSSEGYGNWSFDPPGGPPNEPGDDHDREPAANAARARPFTAAPVHFETKLKPEIIREWNGDTKELSKWVISINNIAAYSNYTCIQLGQQVPLRFTNRALRWFNALDKAYRQQVTIDWPSLRRAITIHFMNRSFMDHNKVDALHTRFRGRNHPHKSPEDYVIRKMEALTILSDWTDSELITEIMNSAPEHWALYIDTSVVNTWDDFLDKVAWHEGKLLQSNEYATMDIQEQLDEMKAMLTSLEIDEDLDPETDHSHQEVDEDLSDDAYTKDNESETDDEPSKQGSYRPLRSFAASVRAYTPNSSEVTQHGFEGDITDRNLDFSCEPEQPIQRLLETKRWIATDFGPETMLNDKLMLEEPEPPPYECVRQGIEIISAYEHPEACPNNSKPAQCATILTSKQRDDVPGGDTWDISDFKQAFVHTERSTMYESEILKEAIEEPQIHSDSPEFMMLIEHAALAWIKSSNLFIQKPTTWDSAFPTNPDTQIIDVANREFRQTGALLDYLVRLLRIRHALDTAYPSQATETADGAHTNLFKYDWSKNLQELTYSDNIDARISTTPAPRSFLRKPRPLLTTHPPAPTSQRTYRLAHNRWKDLADIFIEFAIGTLDVTQGYQHQCYNKHDAFVIFEQDNLIHNLHVQRIVNGKQAKIDGIDAGCNGLLDTSSKKLPVAYKIGLHGSHSPHPVGNMAYLELYNDSPHEIGENLPKQVQQQVSERKSKGKIEKYIDERYIKRRKKRLKDYQVRYMPDRKTEMKPMNAPNIIIQLRLRDKSSKDNPN